MECDEIHRLIASLSLLTAETPAATVMAEKIAQGTKECECSLVGRFITDKDMNLKLIRPALVKSWRCSDFEFSKMRTNVY